MLNDQPFQIIDQSRSQGNWDPLDVFFLFREEEQGVQGKDEQKTHPEIDKQKEERF
jgi:hypothetical protein